MGNCKLILPAIKKETEYSILQALYNLSFPMLWLAMEARCYPYIHTLCCKDKHMCTVTLQSSCRGFPKKLFEYQIWLLSEVRATICLKEQNFKRKFKESKDILRKNKLRCGNKFYKAIGNDCILP